MEQAPRVLSRIVLNPISRFSSRFSYRIIPLLVRWTLFQNPHVAAPRCFHLSHLRRASDQNSNYAVRKTRRAASLAWPGGLEAASTATAACLGGRGPPTAPSCASWTSPLSAPVCFAFRFGYFLLLFLSFALLFGRQPPAEPMFDVYQEAHSGALHRTYRRRTRVHVPPMKQAASNELTAGQLATAVAAGSPQAPQPAPSRRPDLCRGLAHQQQHPAHPTAGRPPGRIEAGYNTNPSPQGAGTSPLLPMEPSGSLWWRCWV